MKLKVKITHRTTPEELFQLGALFTGLAIGGNGVRVSSGSPALTVPADPAELDEPEPLTQAGTEPPKRRRRSKAEIEAEKLAEENAAVASGEAEAQASNEAGLAAAGNEAPAPTPDAPQQDTPPSETASTAPASASPSKDYTEAEVQDLAGKVARGVGPEVVKEKIAELGASRIAELTQEQRNALGEFLKGKLS